MIIGPFIGINEESSLRVIIALPRHHNIENLSCLFSSPNASEKVCVFDVSRAEEDSDEST